MIFIQIKLNFKIIRFNLYFFENFEFIFQIGRTKGSKNIQKPFQQPNINQLKKFVVPSKDLDSFTVNERQDKINELTTPALQEIPLPTQYSEHYSPEDYEDMKKAYQDLVLEQRQDVLFSAYQLLKNQLYELLQFQNEQRQLIVKQQEQINLAQTKQIKKLQENLQEIQYQINGFTNKYNETLNRCLETLNQNKNPEKISNQQIKKLQADLQREKQFINGDIELFIGWQEDCINLLQQLTGIYILPGKKFDQDLIEENKIKMNKKLNSNYYLTRDDMQFKIQNNKETSIINIEQIPSKIVKDQESMEKFKGETFVEQQYLKYVWKSICEEFVKYYQQNYGQ